MQIEGHFEYNKPISVDADLLNDLESIISKYYDVINFSVKLKNGDVLKFDNIEELVEYDNFGDGAIVNMTIWFGYSNYIDFLPAFPSIYSYTKCISAKYDLDEVEKSEEFKRKVLREFEKHTQSSIYVFFSKLSFSRLCIIATFLLSVALTKDFLFHNSMKYNEITMVNFICVMVVFLIGLIVAYYYPRIPGHFFPTIVYLIGEGIKKEERMSKGRVFWGGILVTTIISILLAIVF